jgi:hypothetical protein
MTTEEREAILKLKQLLDIDARATELLAKMNEGLKHPKEVFDVYVEAKSRALREREAAQKSEIARLEAALTSERRAMESALRTEREMSEVAIASKRAAMESELNARKAEAEDALATEKMSLEDAAKRVQADEDALRVLVEEKCKGFPWLARAYADYIHLQDTRVAGQLRRKAHPAVRSAEVLEEMAAERRETVYSLKLAQYKIAYYENLFPWLVEYWDIDDDDVVEFLSTEETQTEDPAQKYLTPAEFAGLPAVDKYQRALDHYLKRRKRPWEIGRDYERYIGYMREMDGHDVDYQGIKKGVFDRGRDLIATKNGHTEIIQCKCWRQETQIHEKHVFQLFGSTIEFILKRTAGRLPEQTTLFPEFMRHERVSATLVTSTRLSDDAREYARVLNVAVHEGVPLRPYPIIKCNTARRTNEKIYHLPFDQQYDRTIVEEERNECYAATVKEAEELGFRRAWRWSGASPTP